MHIVEELIAERAPTLLARPRLFRAVRPILYRMLAYEAAVSLADSIHPLTGKEAFSRVAHHIKPDLDVRGLSHVPKAGRCILIANHPTGLADGLAVFDALRDRRPDHCYLANADALRVIPKGDDIIIPVEWVKSKRHHAKTRDTLFLMKQALEAERCLVIFPSGRLARLTLGGLKEQDWESSAVMIARKYNAPIIPLNIQARNSSLYYLFSWLNAELRDITLFHELLNKTGKPFRLTFGEALSPETLSKKAEIATAQVRTIVSALKTRP